MVQGRYLCNILHADQRAGYGAADPILCVWGPAPVRWPTLPCRAHLPPYTQPHRNKPIRVQMDFTQHFLKGLKHPRNLPLQQLLGEFRDTLCSTKVERWRKVVSARLCGNCTKNVVCLWFSDPILMKWSGSIIRHILHRFPSVSAFKKFA